MTITTLSHSLFLPLLFKKAFQLLHLLCHACNLLVLGVAALMMGLQILIFAGYLVVQALQKSADSLQDGQNSKIEMLVALSKESILTGHAMLCISHVGRAQDVSMACSAIISQMHKLVALLLWCQGR